MFAIRPPARLMRDLRRPSFPEQRPGWGRSPGHEWMRLPPLSASEMDTLVSAVLARVADVPEDLRQRLIRQAGGSPYYLQETIRMLLDDGIISTGAETWTIDPARSATSTRRTSIPRRAASR